MICVSAPHGTHSFGSTQAEQARSPLTIPAIEALLSEPASTQRHREAVPGVAHGVGCGLNAPCRETNGIWACTVPHVAIHAPKITAMVRFIVLTSLNPVPLVSAQSLIATDYGSVSRGRRWCCASRGQRTVVRESAHGCSPVTGL
jgi:hypothetical protein